MSTPDPDDRSSSAALADLIRVGDPEAARQLVVRFQRGVAVILRRAGAPAADVPDLVHDVLTTVLQKIRDGALHEPERLPGYVAATARNLGADAARRAAREGAADGEPTPATTPPPGALDRLLARERVAAVRALLDELPVERDREVLRRTYLLGDAREDVCRDLALTPLQLNRVLHRARERYRALYEEAVRRERDRSER